MGEFRARPWFVDPAAEWDAINGRLVLITHYEGADVEGLSAAATDEVWDCVIACLSFASDGVSFEVIESSAVEHAEPGTSLNDGA